MVDKTQLSSSQTLVPLTRDKGKRKLISEEEATEQKRNNIIIDQLQMPRFQEINFLSEKALDFNSMV